MKRNEIIEKLNQNNNFHLSLKTILITDDEYLKQFQEKLSQRKKTSLIITDDENSYELLFKAYKEKIDYVLINENIDFLLPLLNVVTKDCLNIIKPMIPTLYLLKDNKIIQRLKTTCRKKLSTFEGYKFFEELTNKIFEIINLK